MPLGIEGWRWTLIFGSVCSFLPAVLFFLVPESPRWLAAVGLGVKAELACRRFEVAAGVASPQGHAVPVNTIRVSGFRALASDRVNLKRTALLGALYMLGPWATIGFPLLSAAVMVQKGFQVSDSLLFAGLTMLGPTLGAAVVSTFVDRIPRRLALVFCAGAMIVAGLSFAVSTTLTTLIVIGVSFNLASAVYISLVAIYGDEMLPTHLRASATAGVWGIGRLVSALVPIALLPLLGSYGPLAMFTVISVALLFSLTLVLVAGPPGRERRSVD